MAKAHTTQDRELLNELRLLYRIQNPTIEEVYTEGYEKGLNNESENENPYKAGSTEYHHWQEGWNAAYFEEEPMFELARIEKRLYEKEIQAVNDAIPATIKIKAHNKAGNVHRLNLYPKNKNAESLKTWGTRLAQIAAALFLAAVGYNLIDLAT